MSQERVLTMGGKVLEYEAKTIYRQGYEEGRKEGREEGIKIMVSVLRELDVPINVIVEALQEHYSMTLETAKKYV